jgi:hypothetical protein
MWRELPLAASSAADVRPDRAKTKTSAEADAADSSPRHQDAPFEDLVGPDEFNELTTQDTIEVSPTLM